MIIANKKLPGFSLVEIAIALVIIGLLVGAVLKGQELLVSARLKTIITQLNQYRLATNTFMDRYGSLPGDYQKASTYIHKDLKDGNNDGILQGTGLTNDSGGLNHEATSFWAHLAAAELISDIKPFEKGLAALPTTKMGGYITITHTPLPELSGHWFIIGNPHGNKNNGALFTPLEALSLAKKMDTEDPHSGTVQIRNGATESGKSSGTCLKANGLLNTENKNPACVLYVKL